MSRNTYDRNLFVEVILTEGVNLLYVDKGLDGLIVEWYHGKNGNKVAIPLTDEEDLSIPVVKFYLNSLGLESLIPRMFPEKLPNIPKGATVSELEK